MLLHDVMEVSIIPLEEGIVFFKNSKRMKKLAGVILQKSQFIEDENQRKQIISLVNKINKLSDKFDAIEQMYKARKLLNKKSDVIKQQYKTLETEYADIVDLAKKEQVKTILKNVNAYGTMVAAMILPTLLIGKLSQQFGVVNPITNNKEINPFLRAGVYLGSAGLIRGLGPTGKIENINKDVVNKAGKSLQNKEIL